MSEQLPNEQISAGEPHHHQHIAPDPTAGHASAPDVFTDAEWDQFRKEDFAAGKAVVLLMIGIFGTGVVLYSVVAYTVMS